MIDTKIDAFLKEHLGAQFGDSIDQYPTPVEGWNNGCVRYILVKKPFGYLDKAIGWFEDCKLYKIWFVADIDLKYSENSSYERIEQTLADMAVTFGLASDAFQKGGHRGLFRRSEDATPRPSYGLSKYGGIYDPSVPNGFRRLGVVIENGKLQRRLMAEKRARQRAQGEVLPEKKIDTKDGASVEAALVSTTDDSKKSTNEAKREEEARRDRECNPMAREREEMLKELNSLKEELKKQRRSVESGKPVKTVDSDSATERRNADN